MPVRLVHDEHDWSITLDLDCALLEGFVMQAQRDPYGAFALRFQTHLRQLIGASLDLSQGPPTDAQLRYAIDIARTLGLALPGEALRYRGAMQVFIARFEKHFRDARARRRGAQGDQGAGNFDLRNGSHDPR